METLTKNTSGKYLKMAFIPLAVGINLGIGTIVQLLKLPVYLDSIGTIITALLLGWRSGAIVGVLSFAVSSITVFPPSIYFSGTQIAISLYVYFIGKIGGFRTFTKTFLSGAGLAVLAAVVSAPVLYFLFGGITGNGISIFTLYLESHGFSKAVSVIISGISAELIDKIAQCLIAFTILKAVPKILLSKFYNDVLINNQFLNK